MGLIKIEKRLANTPFFQQNMKHCIPSLHPFVLIGLFASFAILFLLIGLLSYFLGKELLYETFIHYNGNTQHTFKFSKDKLNQKKHLTLYYQVDDFYQNIRSYIISYEQKQLSSPNFAKQMLSSDCTPVQAISDAVDYPCGLIYQTRVTDTVNFYDTANVQQLEKSQIILPREDVKQNTLFGPAFKELSDWQQTADWMHTDTFGQLQKIIAILPSQQITSLTKINDEIQLTIVVDGTHNYSNYRRYVLAQQSPVGNRDETIAFGQLCIIFASINIAMMVILIITHFYSEIKMKKEKINGLQNFVTKQIQKNIIKPQILNIAAVKHQTLTPLPGLK